MVKAGTWGEDHCQLHRFFAWKDVKLQHGAPYRVEAADCLATEDTLKGSIEISALRYQLKNAKLTLSICVTPGK